VKILLNRLFMALKQSSAFPASFFGKIDTLFVQSTLKCTFSSFSSRKCLIPSSPLRLLFESCSTGLRVRFDTGSTQVRHRFESASYLLRLTFGFTSAASEGHPNNCRIRYELVTNQVRIRSPAGW